MLKPLPFLSFCFIFLATQDLSAQGCSDAGVCTAGPIGEVLHAGDSLPTTEQHRHYARMTFSYAIGERSTTVLQGIAELGLGITDRWSVQLRVPYLAAEGDLGSNSGVSDPVITTSLTVFQRSDSTVSGKAQWRTVRKLDSMLGVRLPSGSANATAADGRPLPMPYQTSLGTTDLLVGLNYRHGRWSAALAYQAVMANANENTFTRAAWMDDPKAQGYFESAYLERASDAVARIQYALPVGGFVIQPGLLAIYHTAQDKREEVPVDPAGMMRLPELVAVDGSEGLTLNATVDARYRINARWSAELAYGSPLIVREERPDGLTRSMVLNVGLRFAF